MKIDQEIFNIMLAKSMHQIARIEFRNSKFPYARGLCPLATLARGPASWNPHHRSTIWVPPFQRLDPPLPTCNPMYEQPINPQGNIDLVLSQLTAHNWQKWKRVFLTRLCHKIYRDEAVGLKICKYSWKNLILWKCGIWGNIMKIWYFVNCLGVIEAQI